MSAPQKKECPRCHVVFACQVDDVSNCQCSEIEISKEVIEYIRTHYDDCLCQSCLIALGQQLQAAK